MARVWYGRKSDCWFADHEGVKARGRTATEALRGLYKLLSEEDKASLAFLMEKAGPIVKEFGGSDGIDK